MGEKRRRFRGEEKERDRGGGGRTGGRKRLGRGRGGVRRGGEEGGGREGGRVGEKEKGEGAGHELSVTPYGGSLAE